MHIETLTLGPFAVNCYVVADENNHCLLVDPGDEADRIISFIADQGYIPEKVVITHVHIDHLRTAGDIIRHYGIPFYVGEFASGLLGSVALQGQMFGLDFSPLPDDYATLNEGDTLNCGSMRFSVLHTPGHSPDSICLYVPGHLFAGDVLFRESIGRTDLHGGSYDTLIDSIRNKLFTLPDDTIVYPGHGPSTTIGWEKIHNPFLQIR